MSTKITVTNINGQWHVYEEWEKNAGYYVSALLSTFQNKDAAKRFARAYVKQTAAYVEETAERVEEPEAETEE